MDECNDQKQVFSTDSSTKGLENLVRPNSNPALSTTASHSFRYYKPPRFAKMRFSLAATLLLASSALATRTKLRQPPLITQVGNVALQLEDVVGVTAVEGVLDTLFGGALPKLEDALGVASFSASGVGPGAVPAAGEAVAMLLQGIGLPHIDAYLASATGGAMSSLEGVRR
ncbi:hypothetical protein J3459_017513 [Metarhizium acridum]|nr:hypothetical protein J3459_017513 [Metarhizium acridum]